MTGSARRPAIHTIAALANCLACDELRPVWPIETVIYPGAYHAWTVPDLATARFYPDYVSTKKCPLILLGPKRPALLIDGEAKPFDPAAFGACVAAAPGYSMEFDAAVRAQSITEAVRFLQRILRP